MGSIAVIVPVKGNDPKSRLGTVLSVSQRGQLQVAMLEDVLQALIKAGLIRDTYVVSPQREICRFAERYGANCIQEEEEQGVNAAVSKAAKRTAKYRAWLVVPADLPFIRAKDFRSVINLYRLGASVVISPSEDQDGTNLLLLQKGRRFVLHYDDNSFHKHTREALANSLPMALYYSEEVAFDIDRPRDLSRALRTGRNCSTVTLLSRIARRKVTLNPKMRRNASQHSD